MIRSTAAGVAAVGVLTMLLGACGAAGTGRLGSTSPAAAEATSVTSGPHVVHFAGHATIQFGQSRSDLQQRGVLRTHIEGCAAQLVATAELSPVFDGDRLVLLWVNPPYRTPEQVTVGSTVDEVRRAYPAASVLTPPAGSYTFPGLLVVQGDRAYLFLHDQKTVQKTIIGYAEHARRLYEHGFGAC